MAAIVAFVVISTKLFCYYAIELKLLHCTQTQKNVCSKEIPFAKQINEMKYSCSDAKLDEVFFSRYASLLPRFDSNFQFIKCLSASIYFNYEHRIQTI